MNKLKRGETNPAIVIVVIMMIVMVIPPLTMLGTFTGFVLNGKTILLITIAAIAIWVIAMYNSLIKGRQRVKQASSGIDVYLKQRFDLIPNIVETVKGYVKHEQEVLEQITRLRAEYDNREQGNMKQNQELNERFTNLLGLVEAYPELKANEQFLSLQKLLTKIESQLQAARRIYNVEVTEYNTKRLKFPNNIIANMFNFEEAALFEATEVERQVVKTSFDD
ncbi:MAG: LemA family protein [Clostridia bacterium]|nr:LemA family protein [Clostridia bacterium]